MRHNRGHSTGSVVGGGATRPTLADASQLSTTTTSSSCSRNGVFGQLPDEKAIASGNGINVNVCLAEPMLFLQGFEASDTSSRSTAMLRGSLVIRITKSTKIKAISLKFRGRATTKWPEGIPPKKVEFEEVNSIMSHTWPFFNAQFPSAEHSTGADHIDIPNNFAVITDKAGNRISADMSNKFNGNINALDLKRLSLQGGPNRFERPADCSAQGPSVAQRGFRTFTPGVYVYNFELPIDSHLPETIDVELGSVKYDLEAVVERAGAFKANLVGTKEVTLIRAPAEGSLEQVEPIAISRNWEDQLHYDIVISGKSFPLGAQIPIAFKLTPLAKVQCHRIKVYVTENIEYFCSNKRVHRLEPFRKIQLFEKRADSPSMSAFNGSSIRILSGGGIPYDDRPRAARGDEVLGEPRNLLGNLDADLNVGPTEMEVTVQLPSCLNSRDNPKSQKLNLDTTYHNIQVHHWIKIVMRLSKVDANDPNRRRHFEISIDSPFHILSCHATQSNIALPAYHSPEPVNESARMRECGCPGAATVRRNSPSNYVPTLNSLAAAAAASGSLGTPLSSSPSNATSTTTRERATSAATVNERLERPIHLLRVPSFNPPAFGDDDPPPPLETPPPLYETIASPTSGLADYFARLSDTYDTDSDGDGPGSRARVEVPLTPGGRSTSRSMDEARSWPVMGR